MKQTAIAPVLPGTAFKEAARKSTIVCVTNQYQCERLIHAGRILAEISKTPLLVVNVSTPDLTQNDFAALDHLFGVSKENGASMSIIYSDDPLKALEVFIKQNRALHVVTGLCTGENSILPRLWSKFTSATFFEVSMEGEMQEVSRKSQSVIA